MSPEDRLWPLCRGLHSGHYVQIATMCMCREIEGANRGLARRLTRCVNFYLGIVSEAMCLGSQTSGGRHESTRPTRRCVKADLAKNENALAQFEALDEKLRRSGYPNSLVRLLQTR